MMRQHRSILWFRTVWILFRFIFWRSFALFLRRSLLLPLRVLLHLVVWVPRRPLLIRRITILGVVLAAHVEETLLASPVAGLLNKPEKTNFSVSTNQISLHLQLNGSSFIAPIIFVSPARNRSLQPGNVNCREFSSKWCPLTRESAASGIVGDPPCVRVQSQRLSVFVHL